MLKINLSNNPSVWRSKKLFEAYLEGFIISTQAYLEGFIISTLEFSTEVVEDAMCGCAWRMVGCSRATMVSVAWLSTCQWFVEWCTTGREQRAANQRAGQRRVGIARVARVDDWTADMI